MAGTVSDEEVDIVVSRIMRAKEDEYEIMADDLDDFLHVKAADLPTSTRESMKTVYSDLYEQRSGTYEAFVAGQITPEQFKAHMQVNVEHAFHDIQDILGVDSFLKLFRMPLEVAVATLFNRP